MKSKDVLNLLKVTRVTLMNYVKSGKINATKMANGLYDYDESSVFAFLKKDSRHNVIYCRVSTYKQKNDLARQVDSVVEFCKTNNVEYSTIYKDISSGTDLDRTNFSILMNDVINYKIRNIYITYKDRLTRLSFKTIEQLFNKFGTHIIVINNDNKNNDNEKELFNELISIVHHFSTQTYSKRRKSKLEIIKKDIDLFE
jgi:predicted site-specific integrase-resolvase